MRLHWKPIVALFLMTPFVTELLSGSLPAPKFFQPPVFLFLATIGYGFPVLLLREFAVRRQLGVVGLFVLGVVYGFFNEGILAKTLYLTKNIPINTFDGYGCVFGIAVPWSAMICVWHALHSFLYPVVAVYYLFPSERETPWLNRTWIICLAAPTAVIGALVFFKRSMEREPGNWKYFILVLLLGGMLVWLSTQFPRTPALSSNGQFRLRPILLGGACFLALVLAPIFLAGAKIPPVIFFGYYLLAAFIAWRRLRRHASLAASTTLAFAVGDDFLMALFGIVLAVGRGSIERFVTNGIFILVFAWLVLRLRSAAGSTP